MIFFQEIEGVFSLLTYSTTSVQVKLCLSELKLNVNGKTLDNTTILSRDYGQLPYFRGEYIGKLDPDTNVFLAQQKIQDVLLDSTAQVNLVIHVFTHYFKYIFILDHDYVYHTVYL